MSEKTNISIIHWIGFIASIITIFLFLKQYNFSFEKETKKQTIEKNENELKKNNSEISTLKKTENLPAKVNKSSYKTQSNPPTTSIISNETPKITYTETEGVKKNEKKYSPTNQISINDYNLNNTLKNSKYRIEWLVVNFPKLSWYESKKLLTSLNLKTNLNWKIPSSGELYTLAKNQNKNHNVGLINELVEMNLISGKYWSNNTCEIRSQVQKCLEEYTINGSNSNVADVLSFSGGSSGTYNKTAKLRVIFMRRY